MSFLQPALLLLLLPAVLLWWKLRTASRMTAALRLVVACLLVLALAVPVLRLDDDGRDLVVVVDRSRSMPAEADARAMELVRLAREERRSGDRVGLVTFGGLAAIEQILTGGGEPFRAFEREIDADGSDLHAALEAALELLPRARNGAILVLSDGEANGRDPLLAARRAFARGVRIDTIPLTRPADADLSIERVDLPEEVALGEPFQFTVWVRADRRVEAEFQLEREGRSLSSGRRVFEPGLNRLLFRDVVTSAGIAAYDVALRHAGDRLPENDRARGAVRVRGERRVLVLNHDGADDPLVRALRAGAIPVDVAQPEALVLDALALTRWRAIVLENVAAARLRPAGLAALREHVLERGGGLLMTGGRASFGVGGYHLSAIDPLLPVSMEERQEHKKQGVALAVVLDRSGSMAAPAGGDPTITKMDLANAGTIEAVRLLTPLDSVGVIAVDSSAHEVQALVDVTDPELIAKRVRGIQSQGGGIYVHAGLVAAARMLDGAKQVNRHILLFADAADSEDQDGVLSLVGRLGEMGTTVSVIALGTEGDSDARFLREVAAGGGGAAYFTTEPHELPLLFAQDTLTIARSTFIEEPTGVDVLPDVVSLGRVDLADFPDIAGYNLNYLKGGALAAAATTDEYRAPLLAFWYQGVGRVAAYTGQVGGSHGAELVIWPRFAELFVTLARWLAGQEEPDELFASVRREGRAAVISVEVDPEAATPPDTSQLSARVRASDGEWEEHVLERVGAYRYEARAPLASDGVTLGTVRVGAADGLEPRVLELPPITLPYSPEFERSPDPDHGRRLLARLAEESGGLVDPAASLLWRGERVARSRRPVVRELLLLALVLFLLEIAGRRLQLWSGLRVPRSLAQLASRLQRAIARAPERPSHRREKRDRSEPFEAPPERAAPRPGPAGASADTPAGAAGRAQPAPEQEESLADALANARRRAGRKTRR